MTFFYRPTLFFKMLRFCSEANKSNGESTLALATAKDAFLKKDLLFISNRLFNTMANIVYSY